MFTRQEAKVDLERKLEAVMKWIDYLSFLKTYDATFGPGFKFRPADIEVQISCQMELKDKASRNIMRLWRNLLLNLKRQE